jgi:hypothetical protein
MQFVKRNLAKFPADFMFALTQDEWAALRSQIAALKTGRGQHRKYLPYVFTEHGALMAATILNSPRAVEVSVYVVRAFVQLRELATTHGDLFKRLNELEDKTEALSQQHDTSAQAAYLVRHARGQGQEADFIEAQDVKNKSRGPCWRTSTKIRSIAV